MNDGWSWGELVGWDWKDERCCSKREREGAAGQLPVISRG